MADFTMSRHALQRAVDMAIDAQEIITAYERPRESFYNQRTDSWQLTHGRITLCLRNTDGWVVTTILWARTSDWAADAQLPAPKGRGDTDYRNVRSVVRARKQHRGQ